MEGWHRRSGPGQGAGRPLTLASSSPRRIALLRKAGFSFRVVAPEGFEERMDGADPEAVVRENALGKARRAVRRVRQGIVIGCDTVVVLDGRIIGKPHDPDTARRTLRELSGRTHRVLSGLALVDSADKREWVGLAETEITFREVTEEEIAAYVQGGEPLDKAGAYALQGKGKSFIQRIGGSETNVIGLPMELLRSALNSFPIGVPAGGTHKGQKKESADE